MIRPLRTSPVFDRFDALGTRWAEIGGMRIADAVGESDADRIGTLGIADLSHLAKVGLKGPDASDWVQAQGLPLPQPNEWAMLADGGVLARLAASEFFIEDSASGENVARVSQMLVRPVPGVYPVVHQEAGLALTGSRVNELLVQTCNVNFLDLGKDSRTVIMTTMVGVSVLVVRHNFRQSPCYRLWCDPSFAPYLWDTLTEIAVDLGGGAVGAGVLLGSVQA